MSYLVRKCADGHPRRHMTWSEAARMIDASTAEAVWDLPVSDVIEILDADKSIVSLSRHGMYVDPACIRKDPGCLEACRGYDLRPIFFVREFFSWHMSLYFQQRRDPSSLVRYSHDPRAVLAKTGSLREYTRFCIDNAELLSNHKIMHNWTAAKTYAVLDNLQLYQIGLIERYDESLVVIEDALSSDFPCIDLSYSRPLNADEESQKKGVQRGKNELERQIGHDLLRELEATYAEREVYDRISLELDSRVLHVRNFQEKLDAFKARCAARFAEGDVERPPRWSD